MSDDPTMLPQSDFRCNVCNNVVYYSSLYDAYYCSECKAWVDIVAINLSEISNKINQ